MFDDTYYMKIALSEAQQALDEDEVPIGAVIVYNDKIIAKAHNSTEKFNDINCHAEILAISAANNALGSKYLKGCTLYVTIEPCVMCAGAIGWAQISRVVYGAKDSKKGYTILAPKALHPKATVTTGILENECSSIMKNFFKRKRL